MLNPNALTTYFQELEAQDRYSGVVRITQGQTTLYIAIGSHRERSKWGLCEGIRLCFHLI